MGLVTGVDYSVAPSRLVQQLQHLHHYAPFRPDDFLWVATLRSPQS